MHLPQRQRPLLLGLDLGLGLLRRRDPGLRPAQELAPAHPAGGNHPVRFPPSLPACVVSLSLLECPRADTVHPPPPSTFCSLSSAARASTSSAGRLVPEPRCTPSRRPPAAAPSLPPRRQLPVPLSARASRSLSAACTHATPHTLLARSLDAGVLTSPSAPRTRAAAKEEQEEAPCSLGRRLVDGRPQDRNLVEPRPAAPTDDGLARPLARAERGLRDLDERGRPLGRRLLARLGRRELVPARVRRRGRALSQSMSRRR